MSENRVSKQPVNTTVDNGIAVVTVDRPPVNAIDQEVRRGLDRAFSELRARDDVKAIVLGCAGSTFIAGADIKEFDTGIGPPGYHEVFRLVEDMAVPVVAAIHGTALGAGTEIALACHYRVAADNARLGLPELSLGIIPGAGGTQRMPRLIPLADAADMMLSGRPMPAPRGKELGLIDELVTGDVVAGAVAFAAAHPRAAGSQA
jgi:3-hydroxyacyl-CoA dehydrogenase